MQKTKALLSFKLYQLTGHLSMAGRACLEVGHLDPKESNLDLKNNEQNKITWVIVVMLQVKLLLGTPASLIRVIGLNS